MGNSAAMWMIASAGQCFRIARPNCSHFMSSRCRFTPVTTTCGKSNWQTTNLFCVIKHDRCFDPVIGQRIG